MALYKEQGIVLRTMKLGEADRIVTLLTQGSGKVRAVAKGVRKTRSKFGARLDPFTHVDLLLYKGRELDIVTQADIITPFREIRDSYNRFAAGEVVLEAIDRVTQEHEPSVRTFMLLLGALRRLADSDDPPVVVDAFLLRLASLAGFRPHLVACAACGAPGPHLRFSVAQGGMVCETHRSGAASRVAEATPPYLVSLLDGEWDAIGATSEDVKREGSGLVKAFVEYHFDQPLRAWSHVPR